jgi:hypothetical protein
MNSQIQKYILALKKKNGSFFLSIANKKKKKRKEIHHNNAAVFCVYVDAIDMICSSIFHFFL